MKKFIEDVAKFNTMYGLESSLAPSAAHRPIVPRMEDFKRILLDEVSEVDDIVAVAGQDPVADLTNLADWLGDMIIYCVSEMLCYGLPVEKTLNIIMQSNFSKMGADGKPIIVGGKVGKGPGYWKPEPMLRDMLEKTQEDFAGLRSVTTKTIEHVGGAV